MGHGQQVTCIQQLANIKVINLQGQGGKSEKVSEGLGIKLLLLAYCESHTEEIWAMRDSQSLAGRH